ncbi:MAG: phosphoesterase PA-phosphatase, partial [Bacteroidota bacterium]
MKIKRILSAMLVITAISCGHNSDEYKKVFSDPLLYSRTVKQLNDVVLENNFPPMIASRNYAYATIAAYETMAAGNDGFQSLSGQIKHLPSMPKPEAGKEINFSLATLLSFVKVGNAVTFPEGSMMAIYEDLKKQAKDAGMSSDMLENTVTFSDSVVAAILRWSKKDNYARTRSAEKYTIKQVEGRWIPTPPMYGPAVEPHWKEIRTLVIDSSSEFMPPRPPVYDV